jgi:hypothetical protein
MTETRFALYAGRALGPSKISETVEIIKGSSWTTIMLGLFHIGWGANSSPDHPQSDAEFFSMTQVLSWAASHRRWRACFSISAHAGRRWLGFQRTYERRAPWHPDAGTAR